jgi:hypothetical protein
MGCGEVIDLANNLATFAPRRRQRKCCPEMGRPTELAHPSRAGRVRNDCSWLVSHAKKGAVAPSPVASKAATVFGCAAVLLSAGSPRQVAVGAPRSRSFSSPSSPSSSPSPSSGEPTCSFMLLQFATNVPLAEKWCNDHSQCGERVRVRGSAQKSEVQRYQKSLRYQENWETPTPTPSGALVGKAAVVSARDPDITTLRVVGSERLAVRASAWPGEREPLVSSGRCQAGGPRGGDLGRESHQLGGAPVPPAGAARRRGSRPLLGSRTTNGLLRATSRL